MPHRIRFERVAARSKGQRSGYGANLGMAVSTNRKNRCCRPPPRTIDSCETPTWNRRSILPLNWVLRVQDLNLAKVRTTASGRP